MRLGPTDRVARKFQSIAIDLVDHFFLWLDAARKVGKDVTPESWGDGLAKLGDTYQSALVHDTHFAAGVFDGAATYRVGEYSEKSEVFVAKTQWLPLPEGP